MGMVSIYPYTAGAELFRNYRLYFNDEEFGFPFIDSLSPGVDGVSVRISSAETAIVLHTRPTGPIPVYRAPSL